MKPEAIALRILDTLQRTPDGLARTRISHLFCRNLSAAELDLALERLTRAGRARMQREINPRGGRPVERWLAVETAREIRNNPEAEVEAR